MSEKLEDSRSTSSSSSEEFDPNDQDLSDFEDYCFDFEKSQSNPEDFQIKTCQPCSAKKNRCINREIIVVIEAVCFIRNSHKKH